MIAELMMISRLRKVYLHVHVLIKVIYTKVIEFRHIEILALLETD